MISLQDCERRGHERKKKKVLATVLERSQMTLNSITAKIRTLWAASFQKKYEAAEQLIKLQNNWKEYEEEVNLSWGDWVNNTFGKGMARKAINISKALTVMAENYDGSDPRRYLPPEVLVYMANEAVVPKDMYKEVMDVVLNAKLIDYQNGRNVINKYLGRTNVNTTTTLKERKLWVTYTKKLMKALDKAALNAPEPPPQLKVFLD